MMAIGGAIGTGLFYGSSTSIAAIGPSVIACYAAAGIVIYFIMRALGELLTYRPVSGSFADYAREFLGPFAGFVTDWPYWAFWITACCAALRTPGDRPTPAAGVWDEEPEDILLDDLAFAWGSSPPSQPVSSLRWRKGASC